MRLGLWHAIQCAFGIAPTDPARDRREAELRHTYEHHRMRRQQAARELRGAISRIGMAERAGDALQLLRGRDDDP